MNKVGGFFIPNYKIGARPAKLMLTVQICGLIGLWFGSPFIFLPRPMDVGSAIIDLWNQGIAVDLITSFTLNIESIIFATIISLLLVWAGTLQFFRPWVEFIGNARFLSMVGLTFFFTIMTSNGHQLKLSMLVFSITVFFVTGMVDVLRCIPKEQWDLARVLHMSPWRALYEVVILGQADKAFDVLRQNVAIGWMMLSFVESMSRSEGGIGAVLSTQNKYFHLSEVFAIQIIIFVMGLGQDRVLKLFKRAVCPYAFLQVEAR